MKEWICKEEPLIRADGASVGCGFRQIQELVRCKDCKYLIDHYGFMDDGYCKKTKLKPKKDWFCADGERREGR